jgi:hypothetical protein
MRVAILRSTVSLLSVLRGSGVCKHCVHVGKSICRCGCHRYVTLFLNEEKLPSLRPSGHLQGGRRHAVTVGSGPQAVPLLHSCAVSIEHPAPVVGFRGARGVLADDNPPDEVVTAFHVVTKH